MALGDDVFAKRQLFQRASSTARNRALEAQSKPLVLRMVLTINAKLIM